LRRDPNITPENHQAPSSKPHNEISTPLVENVKK
jgi:hypothetical protein